MQQELYILLPVLKTHELREVANVASILARIKKSLGGIEQRVLDAIGSDNPVAELRTLENRLGSHESPTYRQTQKKLPKLEREQYDKNRAIIRDAIYEYFDTHKKAPRDGIPIDYFYDNIPKVRKMARNVLALAGYLRTIRKEPDSRIKYDRVTQTYSIIDKPRRKS